MLNKCKAIVIFDDSVIMKGRSVSRKMIETLRFKKTSEIIQSNSSPTTNVAHWAVFQKKTCIYVKASSVISESKVEKQEETWCKSHSITILHTSGINLLVFCTMRKFIKKNLYFFFLCPESQRRLDPHILAFSFLLFFKFPWM